VRLGEDLSDRRNPVGDWERERNARIVRGQGRGNPFVTDAGALGRSCD
jgi:deoxyribonuclease-1